MNQLVRLAVNALAVLGLVGAGFGCGDPAIAMPGTIGPQWGRALEVRPPAGAGSLPDAALYAVSCPASGECVAGGNYLNRSGSRNAMTAAESGGRWRRAQAVPLPTNAGRDPEAAVLGISCSHTGSCVAVGSYLHGHGQAHLQGFIATATRGRWHRAIAPGLPANAATTADAMLLTVSCTSTSSCVAAGWYVDQAGHSQIMIVAESRGRWHRARKLSLPANARANPGAIAHGLSCSGAGSCALVGTYVDGANRTDALAAAESGGHWGAAFEIRLPPNPIGNASLASVTCTSATRCVAAGQYQDSLGFFEAMAVPRVGQLWGRGVEIERAADATVNPVASLASVSCVQPSICLAVGGYQIAGGRRVGMLALETAGQWDQPADLTTPPNSGTGSRQSAYLNSVSCVRHGVCVAVGVYADNHSTFEAMVVTRPAR